MAVYGGYETFEEFHRGALTTVWKARPGGASSGEIVAVKVCRPPDWGEENSGRSALAAGMQETVEDLRALGAAGSARWAPVLAAGEQGNEGYWVSRFFPRSLERIIEGRAQLAAEDLLWVAASIAQALEELQQRLDRPHGNLKSANVFIDGEGRIAGAPILLSDLKPRSELDVAADRTTDFHALGRMLVHLVRRQHANLQAAIGWPLEPGPEWKRLGGAGERWRDLCSLLLNPNPAPAEQDWALVGQRLRQIGLERRTPRAKIVAGAAAVVVLAGLTGGYLRLASYEGIPGLLQMPARWLGNEPKAVAIMPPEWAELCSHYNNWLGEFLLATRDPKKTATWAADAHLTRHVLRPLLDAGPLDPRKIAGVSGDLAYLADQDLEPVKRGFVPEKLRRATGAVARANQGFLEWPERQKLVTLAAHFATDLKWVRPAAELQRVVDGGAAGTLSAGHITEILRLSGPVGLVEKQWDELLRRAQILGTAGDPVMGGVAAYLTARVAGAAGLEALQAALLGAATDTSRWLDWVQGGAGGQPRFDRERFARESSVRTFTGAVTDATLQTWEREVADFAFVSEQDDPRKTAGWNAIFKGVEDAIKTVREEERTTDGAAAAAAALQTRLEAARRQTDALRMRTLVRRDLASVETELRTVNGELEALAAKARDDAITYSPKVAEWLAHAREVKIGTGAGLLEWNRRRDEILRGATVAELERKKTEFRDLRTRYGTLENFFRDLTGERGVGTLAAFDGRGVAEDLAAALQSWAETRRQRASEDWLKLIPWKNGIPEATLEEFLARAEVRGVAQQLAVVLGDAARLGRDFSTFAGRVDQGYGLDDPATAAAVGWQGQPLLRELEGIARVHALLDVVKTLENLRRETQTDALVTAAASPALGVAFAGWSRLGELDTWSVAGNLEAELRLETQLRQRLERAVTDPVRQGELRALLERGGRDRWRQALRAATDERGIGEVLARRDAFRVSDDELSPAERYNLELYRVKRTGWITLSETDLLTARDAAVSRLSELAGPNAPVAVTSGLLALRDVAVTGTKGEESDVRKLGPGALPGVRSWKGEISPDGRVVAFTKTLRAQEQTLRFQLIESESVVPFYLGTTEISLGLVVDLAADPLVKARLKQWLDVVVGRDPDSYDPTVDDRTGPLAWRLERDGAIRLYDSWTPARQTTWPPAEEFYAPNVPAPGKPDTRMPLQFVPPMAAQYLARDVLGCRLPTPEEWRGVVELALPTSTAEPGGANRRDAVWVAQRDHLLDRRVQVAHLPIDAQIFWPGPISQLKHGRDAGAAVDHNDGTLWFSPVSGDGADRMHHLFGNVAEFLYEEKENEKRYYVAGGSALSPPEIDPAVPYEVKPAMALEGFSDVGLRLAFNAPGSVTGRNRLQQIIRNLPFLRP